MSHELKSQTQFKAVELRVALKELITRLTESEKSLWSLRLQEVGIWKSVHPAESDARSAKIHEQILLVLDRREGAVNRALDQIASIDETYGSLKGQSEKADAAVAAARERFRKAEAEVDRRVVHDPSIVALDREEARLLRISDLNASWNTELDELVAARVSEFRADRVFAYLDDKGYGTEGYSAGWLTRRLDNLIAGWISFSDASANLESVLAYPDEYAATMRRLKTSIDRIPSQRQLLIRQIKNSLDPEREVLADTLNDAAGVVARFDEAKAAKASAVSRISHCIGGADEETVMVTEAVVALLARERAAAALRADESHLRKAAMEVDELLKRRIIASRATDDLRREAADMLSLVTDIQKLLDDDAEREVGADRFEFAIVRAASALGD
ncbi:hypothetical protein G6L37_04670 [Agrobacterium rubi]|nr:hypothetical protein [Agrobacterium rubi]NTF24647.1 hypothetical protein [Agrobacterium rubi]